MADMIQIDAEVKRKLEEKAYELGLVFSTPNEVLRNVLNLDKAAVSKVVSTTPNPVSVYPLKTATDIRTESRSAPARRQKIGSRLLREHPHIQAQRGYYSKFLPAGNTPYQFPTAFPAVFFDPEGYFIVMSENSLRANPHIRVGKQVNVLNGISSLTSYIRCGHTHE